MIFVSLFLLSIILVVVIQQFLIWSLKLWSSYIALKTVSFSGWKFNSFYNEFILDEYIEEGDKRLFIKCNMDGMTQTTINSPKITNFTIQNKNIFTKILRNRLCDKLQVKINCS